MTKSCFSPLDEGGIYSPRVKKLGILTGGGDCPGMNAVIRALSKHAMLSHGWQVVGIEDGFQGLYQQRYRPIVLNDVRGLLARGGTILGSSNQLEPFDEEVALRHLDALGLEALVCVGGEGTLKIAHALAQRGARVVGVPKTIDNDVDGTELSFGHVSACQIATEAIDRLHTTAESHDRVMLCEVMGRYAGWIAMAAGISGGADAILIPELPYQVERVAEAVRARTRAGISFSIIVVAEGARPVGGEDSVLAPARGGHEKRLGGAADRLARELAEHVDHEVRTTVLGHVQRGGSPAAFDRLLATRFGTAAVDLVAAGQLGRMVCLRGEHIESVPIGDACAKLKRVDPSGELVRAARATGVELGG
jgi:ATP-dependent phosphofructokinase / diphosphate-dependent phosphofructokinase